VLELVVVAVELGVLLAVEAGAVEAAPPLAPLLLPPPLQPNTAIVEARAPNMRMRRIVSTLLSVTDWKGTSTTDPKAGRVPKFMQIHDG
jgi:hypothetical protein